MPLLVVACAADETHLLTLGELDALSSCNEVLFEDPDHPLIESLAAAGVRAGTLGSEPDASSEGQGLVARPDSARIVPLAKGGARVLVGGSSPVDDLTAAHAAPISRQAQAALGEAVAVMARLYSDDGCPWDVQQTHRSLTIHLLEEAHEVIDAIETQGPGPELEEELGDVLLQVAFHSRMAERAGSFDVSGVARTLVAKLVARHPHVFGDVSVSGASEVLRNWEQIKAAEKKRSDPFADIPGSLPALLYAAKVLKRSASLSDEVTSERARLLLDDALADGPEADLGEALLWLVALARSAGVDPEGALRGAARRHAASFDAGP